MDSNIELIFLNSIHDKLLEKRTLNLYIKYFKSVKNS